MDNPITQQEKTNVLQSNVNATSMGVPFAKFRFPPIDGIQQKVTLVCNKDAQLMNIGFKKDAHNTINGNIANKLLDLYPSFFKVMKVNGKPYMQGIENIKENEMLERFMSKLKEQYDIVPKKNVANKVTKRDRPSEPKSTGSKSKSSKPFTKA